MKVAITGYNGYLAGKISQKLRKEKIEVIGIPRQYLYNNQKLLVEILSSADAVINLAGASILRRWTKKNRAEIFDSRILTTKNLIDAINKIPVNSRPGIFISASAIGIYQPGLKHSEKSIEFDHSFIGEVVECWENASQLLPDRIRRVVFRTGIVIGKNAKTIQKMLLPFKVGFGAKLGNGIQAFPFIHVDDVVEAYYFALTKNEVKGIFNLVAPLSTSNKKFTKAFGKILKRPTFLTVPKFVLKLIFGKASNLLTESPDVEPEALLNSGFCFIYPDIDSAMKEILE